MNTHPFQDVPYIFLRTIGHYLPKYYSRIYPENTLAYEAHA
ncbi:uncharacterized protein ANIA_11588 [Aspergillus nidulans FGSC A4]|uniref:Uncharacterized protein n=1 Tax=Emericella nidulans (strain FGSC A4 / ATCC 38163 / CBS 112.46 / NRRL 194 / M139) TaxID=227321 RepID=C8V6Q0_EMENI|nr:hypothetical protein [Aspergillus nidulans FGSC A4]CBF73959.1 TPA: hypothetical protein ANIA_11588 [Aspergillus nidulans FGSC A4]